MVEVNGPANIIMFLEFMRAQGEISDKNYEMLKTQAEKTIKYMKLRVKNPELKWQEVE